MKRANSDQRIYVQQQEALAIEGENTSKASIADYNAHLAEKEAEAMRRAEVARSIIKNENQFFLLR